MIMFPFMKKKQGFGTKIVSWVPFGLGKTKPHHFREMAEVVWENRDNLSYASKILLHGVCDGCSLGPYGLRDHTIKGIHLCMSRLRLLRLNTMKALNIEKLSDVHSLQSFSGEQLRKLGRLPYPMIRQKGEKGFRRISWNEAFAVVADHFRKTKPERFAMYTTSRGLTNEVYYVAGKFVRLLGTNNIDNAARLCHAASTVALKQTVGVAAATCSYRDWIWSELIVLAGANIANNQPVATKYLYYAKQNGARIVVVNPYKEPGLENYWVPSITKSALFGTRLMDEFFPVGVGGDVAFFNGVAKILIENDWIDRDFIRDHTNGYEELKQSLSQQNWETLEKHSGTTRGEMFRFAKMYAGVKTAVLIWSMGLTQHKFGVDNVKSLVNVGLIRGMIGRPNTGLVPIRGHSGVQGAAEVGSVPNDYFAGLPVNETNAQKLSEQWGFPVPFDHGLSTSEMLDAAHGEKLDIFYIMGGNFLETMPDPMHAREALERVPLRIHQDIILNSSMLVDPAETILLFPGQTRYEQRGGGTITSTERRIRFSPEIPGPRIGEAMSEWEILVELSKHVMPPEKHKHLSFPDAEAIRNEMGRLIPLYTGIEELKKEKDSFQYGGARILNDGICSNLPDMRARFSVVVPQNYVPNSDEFYLATRRGKQFNTILFDPNYRLIGSKSRDEIYLNAEDADRLGIKEGERIVLKSETGELRGVCRTGELHPGTVQVFWPEANVLIPRRIDPESHEPDYNATVKIAKSNR